MSRVIRNVVVVDDDIRAPAARPRRLTDMVGDTITDAYERGKMDGLTEGQRASDRAIAVLGDQIEAALQASLAELKSLQRERISFLISEALAIAEFVLGREPSAASETLMSKIEAALSALDDEPLSIHVSSADAETVGAAFGSGSVRVVADDSLRQGEARISGPWADADLTIQAAIDAAKEALE